MNASSTADLVKRALYYDMLTGHQEAIEQTITGIGSGSEIEGISIFDKKGRVVYSSHKDEVGKIVTMENATCQICHKRKEKPLESVPEQYTWRIASGNPNTKILTLVMPLGNEPS
ncbi:MAG TPA: hypothetical protein DCP92_15465, partial [Nitrospiraceae bacterium]|nr:hypothetical protein [Nitrospiraceae bacterium]